MHGIGNDFVVLDLRDGQVLPSRADIARMGDRHTGIGFDQLLSLEPAINAGSILRYQIWNRDGSPAGQCGNGARCVAMLAARELADSVLEFNLDSPTAVMRVRREANNEYSIEMGEPNFEPKHIPLNTPSKQVVYQFQSEQMSLQFGAVSMGNPHAVIELSVLKHNGHTATELAQIDVATIASQLQAAGLFSDGVNVGFVQVVSRDHIRLRVVERGVGETLACGSGACAAVAVLRNWDRVDAEVRVSLPGGDLQISWPGPRHSIRMRGPAALVYQGEWFE